MEVKDWITFSKNSSGIEGNTSPTPLWNPSLSRGKLIAKRMPVFHSFHILPLCHNFAVPSTLGMAMWLILANGVSAACGWPCRYALLWERSWVGLQESKWQGEQNQVALAVLTEAILDHPAVYRSQMYGQAQVKSTSAHLRNFEARRYRRKMNIYYNRPLQLVVVCRAALLGQWVTDTPHTECIQNKQQKSNVL